MRSLFTRAAQHTKGHRLTPVAFAILVVAIFVIITTAKGKAAFRAPSDNITTGSLPPPSSMANEDAFMRHATQGTEGLDLAARLTESGGFIQRPVSWQIFQRDAELGLIGKSVFNDKTPIVETNLSPGTYRIEVKYGHASAIRDITILPKTRLGVTFVLNVGGVRTLSRVVGMDASHYSSARHTIIALPDNKPEKFITDTVEQGQIVRLAAGEYRIESRFDQGNTLAVANVTVKPGILTSLNIDHQAAFAKLSLFSDNKTPIKWQVHSHQGNWTKSGESKIPSQTPSMILAPGRYTFSANIDGKNFKQTVSLLQGKATTIILGN